jgi:hypothetical protein
MNPHTPGPWAYEFDKMGGYDCMSDAFKITAEKLPKFEYVAEIDLAAREDTTDEMEANARLIAAAPRMYDALILFDSAFEKWNNREDGGEDDLIYAAEVARRALMEAAEPPPITKAKGE